MRLLLLALALTLPAPVFAEEAPQTAKERKICRETPARTGSNRPGKRVCRTKEEWKVRDQAESGYDGGTTTTSTRSQGNTADD